MDNEQKRVQSFRVSTLTIRQLDWLAEQWGTSKTETLALIVERVYRVEHAAEDLAASVGGRAGK